MTPYEVLGVSPTATPGEVKTAWRLLIQKNHPDRGGVEAISKMIQAAYDLLSDPKRRALFDETGSTEPTPSQLQSSIKMCGNLMQKAFREMAGADDGTADPIQRARKEVQEILADGELEQRGLAAGITLREKALKRLVWRKETPVDHLTLIIEGQIAAMHLALKANEGHIAMLRGVLDLLSDYTFELASPASPKAKMAFYSGSFFV